MTAKFMKNEKCKTEENGDSWKVIKTDISESD